MAIKPTPMQQAAIDAKSNVLVAAAAGSGKTAVLTERVIRMLKDETNPVSADRLLIVTFTNAAAKQMRSRIEKRLYSEIAQNPDNLGLLRQKHLLNNADICTIDSFCIKLVRENFEALGIKPDFKTGDGSGLYAIRQRVLNELLGGYFMQGNAAFDKLLELTGCEYDEGNLFEIIGRLYSYSQQLPFPNVFLDGLVHSYNVPFQKGNVWFDSAFQKAEEMLLVALSKAEKMKDATPKIVKNIDKFADYIATLIPRLQHIKKVCEEKDWDKFYNCIKDIKLDNLPSSEKGDNAAEDFKQNKAFIADLLKSMKELFCQDKADMQLQIDGIRDAAELLVELTKKYSQMLFDAYNEENEFTFSDIEQMALRLLCTEKQGEISVNEIADSLAAQYDEVLVDEYQDVNDLQDTLFQVLSGGGERLFVVGDVKQCIYGFRGSNPANFLNRKDAAAGFENAQENQTKKIILAENFRSCKGVCDCVNFFFSLFFVKEFGGMEYTSDEQLIFAADIPKRDEPTVALKMVNAIECDSTEDVLIAEANAIAKYIKETMRQGEIIKGENGMRSANYGDFAILLDKLKGRGEIIADALMKNGISVDYSGGEFLETVEISTVISLLKIIDNPLNDVHLLCAMLSPVFNFTAEQMADMRLGSPKTNLFTAVKTAAENGNSKVKKFFKDLNDLRQFAAVNPVDSLLSSIFDFNDCFNKFCAMPSPKVRKANLLALHNIAKEYSQNSKGDIYGFIKYLETLPPNAFKTDGAAADGVKIMTMHNSKGLQFPVCIVANTTTRFNNADSVSAILFDEKLGLGFRYYNEQENCITDTLAHKIVSFSAAEISRQERMRLLYVALTRAKDRLCIFASYKDIESKLRKTVGQLSNTEPFIPDSVLKGASSMADWILSAAVLHPNCKDVLDSYKIKAPCKETEANIDICVERSSCRQETLQESQPEFEANRELAQQIKENIEFDYPFDKLKNIRQKASVSLLSKSHSSYDFAFSSVPDFMAADGLSAAGRGTVMHKVLQYVDFKNNANVIDEIERLVEYQFITENEAKIVDIKAIERFFESSLYKRIAAADEVHRESRFVTEFSIGDIYDDVPQGLENEKMMLQGAMDLCFIENGRMIIVDFKTDRVDSMEVLKQRYSKQLGLYQKACEKIYKLPVTEKIIYSLCLSESIGL